MAPTTTPVQVPPRASGTKRKKSPTQEEKEAAAAKDAANKVSEEQSLVETPYDEWKLAEREYEVINPTDELDKKAELKDKITWEKKPEVAYTFAKCIEKGLVVQHDKKGNKENDDYIVDGINWGTICKKSYVEEKLLFPNDFDTQVWTTEHPLANDALSMITPGATYSRSFHVLSEWEIWNQAKLNKITGPKSGKTGLKYFRHTRGGSFEGKSCFTPCQKASWTCACGGVAAAGLAGLHEQNPHLKLEHVMAVCKKIDKFGAKLLKCSEEDIRTLDATNLLVSFTEDFYPTRVAGYHGQGHAGRCMSKFAVYPMDCGLTTKYNSQGNPPGLVPFCQRTLGRLFGDEERFNLFVTYCLTCTPNERVRITYPIPEEHNGNHNLRQLAPCHAYNCIWDKGNVSLSLVLLNLVVEMMVREGKFVTQEREGLPVWPDDSKDPLEHQHKIIQHMFAGDIIKETISMHISFSSYQNYLGPVKELLGKGGNESGSSLDKQTTARYKIAIADGRLNYIVLTKDDNGKPCLALKPIVLQWASYSLSAPFNTEEYKCIKHHSDIFVLHCKAAADDMANLVKKENPDGLPYRTNAIPKFGNRPMKKFCPALENLFSLSYEGTNGTSPMERLFLGDNCRTNTLKESIKVLGRDLVEDAKKRYLDQETLDDATRLQADRLDYNVHMRAELVQGKIDWQGTVTTCPHTRIRRSQLKTMQRGKIIGMSYIIPLGKHGNFVRVYRSSEDYEGKVIFIQAGSALALPMTYCAEYGYLSDQWGSPFLIVDIVVGVDGYTRMGEGREDMETSEYLEQLLKERAWDYPHLDCFIAKEMVELGDQLGEPNLDQLPVEIERKLAQMYRRFYRPEDKQNCKGEQKESPLAKVFYSSEQKQVHWKFCF